MKRLDEAEKASDAALEKLGAAFRAQEHFEVLHRSLERSGAASVSTQDHRSFIAALANGSDVDVPAGRPDQLNEVAQQLADAESEIRKWRGVRSITEQEITARRVLLKSARRDVANAANAAAASSVDNVDAIVEATSANLARLWQLNLLSPGDARISSFFHAIAVMDQPALLRHPAATQLREYRDALQRDPDAAAL